MDMKIMATTVAVLYSLLGGLPALSVTTWDVPQIDPRYPPVTVHIPTAYDPSVPTPLFLLLHAYGNPAQLAEDYHQFLTRIDDYGYLYAYPEGRTEQVNPDAFTYWDANDHCCKLPVEGPRDDSDIVYLMSLIGAIKDHFGNVDEKRVFIYGRSNGGSMAYRMACDHPETVAAVVSLAGPSYYDETLCDPLEAVHVLHIHGTLDTVALYNGGVHPETGDPYPGALEVVSDWIGYNGCSSLANDTLPALDLDDLLPGPETLRFRYAAGCHFGGSTEHWRINNGAHRPSINENFRTNVLDFLFAHPNHRLEFASETRLQWDRVEVATDYTIYRGDLSALVDQDADGLPDGGYGSCVTHLDPDTTDEVFDDTAIPLSGDGFHYLVSYVDDFEGIEGKIGKTGSGLERPINVPCP